MGYQEMSVCVSDATAKANERDLRYDELVRLTVLLKDCASYLRGDGDIQFDWAMGALNTLVKNTDATSKHPGKVVVALAWAVGGQISYQVQLDLTPPAPRNPEAARFMTNAHRLQETLLTAHWLAFATRDKRTLWQRITRQEPKHPVISELDAQDLLTKLWDEYFPVAKVGDEPE